MRNPDETIDISDVDEWDQSGTIFHCIERTGSRFTADLAVRAIVTINGVTYEGERSLRLSLKRVEG